MCSYITVKSVCPECGGGQLRHTAPNKDGFFSVCDTCGHTWHRPRTKTKARDAAKRQKHAKLAPLGREQAIARFLTQFPNGFSDAEYLRRERTWKWEKHLLWRETTPNGIGALATTAPEQAAYLIERMMQTKAPMLHPTGEIVPMRDAVHRPLLASKYFAALDEMLAAGKPSAASFDRYVDALTSLPLIGKGNLGKWTIVTYIPFLAAPAFHVFLKPGRTRAIVDGLGADILYSSTVKWDTYERLLDFCADLLTHLAPHGAKDMIDVQSFIWAVTSE